ncbi:unnamed protein product [Orchesella dallaii]|uniref:CUB domain-containing protein n=1 Tax=Orchesella dallaii TaxID=48710 RepID=A0ABP1R4L3_9HEXA
MPCFPFFVSVILSALVFLCCITSAVNPGCKCVRFTSTYGKEWGVFTSPDYPASYPGGIRCLLYSFTAPAQHIVHVHFDRIHLSPSPNGCGVGADFLKMFVHVDEHGVNERTPWSSLLCGSSFNQSFYSSSRHLVIQFHSAPSSSFSPTISSSSSSSNPSGNTGLSSIIAGKSPTSPSSLGSLSSSLGFYGRFRFLNSSQFESTGRLMKGTKCDYQFTSSSSSSSNRTIPEEGRFFSPHYPSSYPHNIKCAYIFYASLHKRIRIVFETVALEPGQYSCLNKTDVIRVLDGINPKAPVIALICNTVKGYEILSSGPYLKIEFIANSEKPGTGFRANYKFVKVELDSYLDNTRQLPLPDLLTNGQDGLPQASTLIPQCNQVITSDAGRNGSFSSPNYPHYYTAKTQCRYDFIGHGKERVQILFTDFSLHHPDEREQDQAINLDKSRGGSGSGGGGGGSSHGSGQILFATNPYSSYYFSPVGGFQRGSYSPHPNLNWNRVNEKTGLGVDSKRCIGADVVLAYIHIDNQLEKVAEYCGYSLPPPLMSSGHRLTLEFSGASSSNFARGFHATYAFVEDFGITTGRQLPDFPCGFIFNSTEGVNGTFASPNFPGLYPRNTECHYFFHGDEDEHVALTFNYFHIDGILPCSEASHSDYVEFSNFMPVDTRFRRKCGYESHPFLVISEKNFFRMSFMSNERYDGSGFVGSYHFTNNLDHVYAAANGVGSGKSGGGRKMKIFSADSDPDKASEGKEKDGGVSGAADLSFRAIPILYQLCFLIIIFLPLSSTRVIVINFHIGSS